MYTALANKLKWLWLGVEKIGRTQEGLETVCCVNNSIFRPNILANIYQDSLKIGSYEGLWFGGYGRD